MIYAFVSLCEIDLTCKGHFVGKVLRDNTFQHFLDFIKLFQGTKKLRFKISFWMTCIFNQ